MKRIYVVLVGLFAVSAHAATFSVTTTNDSGAGTLRQAIVDANASNGVDTIDFAIAGPEPHTITPATALPTITDPVIIDGYTQPGSSPNTLNNGCNAVVMIELNLSIADSALTVSAGNSTIRGLVINRNSGSGLTGSGILLITLGSNVVEGCFLGTDVAGLAARPNAAGVSAYGTSDGNLIGGTSPAGRNVISGNGGNGVFLRSSTNSVLGNFIGVDRTGVNVLGNTGNGIHVQFHPSAGFPGSVGNRLGGDAPGAGNVIGANGASGIRFDQDGTPMQTQVKGNFIGTDFTGTVDLGNQTNGVYFDALENAGRTLSVVGDTTPNVIAFNREHGIRFGSGAANLIARNLIYSNGLTGIRVPLYVGANSNNTLSANSIFNNGGLGIALEEETPPLPNDNCDTDAGSNNRQNYPVLTAASSTVNDVTIAGSLNSRPNTVFTLEFFASIACDPSGFGEGEFFIGATNITTDANCTNNFIVTFPTAVAGGMFITATATDPSGNTSEFSLCRTNQSSTAILVGCSLSPSLATNNVSTAHTVTATITSNSIPANGVLVNFSVMAGPNVGQTGTDTTSVSGTGSFTYTGSGTPGTDTIRAISTVAGSSSTCTATKVWITVNQPPVAVCQAVTTNANASCQVSLVAANFDGGSFDNDGTITSRVINPTGPFAKGVQQVVLTVTDNIGASLSCTTTVTVVDNIAPSIICHSDIISNLAAGVTNTIVTFSAPTVAENCAGVSTNIVPPSGSNFPLGTNIVTCTAIDNAGNTNSCTFNVIVTAAAPNIPPIAVCQDVTVPADANCSSNVPPISVDNGSSDPDGNIVSRSLTPPGPYELGATPVTFTVTDDQGAMSSCIATVTVIDVTLPTISCSGNITTNVPTGGSNVVVNFSAPVTSDNCGIASAFCTPASGSTFDLGTSTVTCTAIDNSGNTNTCTFSVIVQDTPVVPHDFALVKLRAPRRVKLDLPWPVSKLVRATIVNLSGHDEQITTYSNLVTLVAQTISPFNCPDSPVTLLSGRPNKALPLTLRPKKKLTVNFEVAFQCANDAAKGAGHEDYRFVATVNHAAIDDNADTAPANDACPRNPSGSDKGCGAMQPTKVLGGDVLTDVFVK